MVKENMQKIGRHRYVECGLGNIYVTGFEVLNDMGEKFLYIPRIRTLHNLISAILIKKHGRLTRREFYFLRAVLAVDKQKVSDEIGETLESLERWEKRGIVTRSIDEKFRQLVLRSLPDIKKTANEIESLLAKRNRTLWGRMSRVDIVYTEDDAKTPYKLTGKIAA